MIQWKGGKRMEKMGRDMEGLYSWRRENIKRVVLDLNKATDKDILEWIEKKPNKRDYLISLIRKDIEESQ